MNFRAVLITVPIWLVLTVVFALVGIYASDWPKAHALATRGVQLKGKVVGKQPDNHLFIEYKYVVNGATYFGLGSASGLNPEFDHLAIGDEVTLFYDPDNPNDSILGDARAYANSSTFGVLFITILAPLGFMFGMYRKGWLPISPRKGENHS